MHIDQAKMFSVSLDVFFQSLLSLKLGLTVDPATLPTNNEQNQYFTLFLKYCGQFFWMSESQTSSELKEIQVEEEVIS